MHRICDAWVSIQLRLTRDTETSSNTIYPQWGRHEAISQKGQSGIKAHSARRRESRQAFGFGGYLFFSTSLLGVFRARGSEDAQRDVGRSLQAICHGWDK
jgi:hypothetical protein